MATATDRSERWRRVWHHSWPVALLLLIACNVLFFGGNAAIDIWQTLSPGQQFSGVITGHAVQNVGTNDNQTQLLELTIRTDNGQTLIWDVTQRTYDLTNEGQHVVGEQDSGALLDHTQALRKLTADGTVVFDSRPLNRAINAIVILVVMLAAGAFFSRWVILSARRSGRQRAVTPPNRAPQPGM
jgi:hypothetical protein